MSNTCVLCVVRMWFLCSGLSLTFPRLQEARLALLMELLQQREESQEETKVQRLDLKYSQLQADKQARLQKIHNNYVLCAS